MTADWRAAKRRLTAPGSCELCGVRPKRRPAAPRGGELSSELAVLSTTSLKIAGARETPATRQSRTTKCDTKCETSAKTGTSRRTSKRVVWLKGSGSTVECY
ncbi:hypothetical protein GN244_ATG15764 [Phytophthora infestans]|uniref:Uncharacterized protein n=1 Tax=Phytophthora infestans TaxID=4787 RepID=A0A833WFP3_PHYIN|nr:hypothetical protein GN244_ATG15764 [Phytophthora infestans]